MSKISKYNNNLNVVANTLRKYRVEKKMSYAELSAKLELMGIIIHKQNIYDIERNTRTVKDYELFGIAHILGIDINDFFADIRKDFE